MSNTDTDFIMQDLLNLKYKIERELNTIDWEHIHEDYDADAGLIKKYKLIVNKITELTDYIKDLDKKD
jgi:hypothetical protein